MKKEAIDDHIGRYIRRIQLGLRFLGHGARAHTTCQWTGLTPDQLVTVRRRSKFKVHDEKNECRIGDTVRFMETRPLSKDKCWRLLDFVTRVER